MNLRKIVSGVLFLQCCLFTNSAEATNGYWQVGYGTRSIGMGGVATAYPQDTIVAATNPAGMYWVGTRGDIGMAIFRPLRSYSYKDGYFGDDHIESKRTAFPIPHFGYNKCVCDNMTLGVSLYGNGGMNTKYPRNNGVFGPSHEKLGVDYAQAIVAPTVAYRVMPCHSIGASLLVGAQRLKLYGLQNFDNAGASSHPGDVTNDDYQYDIGIGARFGWIGKVCDCLWLGAAGATPVWMTKNHKYKGTLAEGRLSIPANLSVGFKYEATPCMNIAFDYQYIFYNSIKAIGNSIDEFFAGNLLGKDNGAGFGWKNLPVYKVGVDYHLKNGVIVRAGYSHTSIPYSSNEIDFNIITPAVPEHHYTVGMSCKTKCGCIDFGYFFAPKSTRRGVSKFGLGKIEEDMYQHYFEINYSWN